MGLGTIIAVMLVLTAIFALAGGLGYYFYTHQGPGGSLSSGTDPEEPEGAGPPGSELPGASGPPEPPTVLGARPRAPGEPPTIDPDRFTNPLQYYDRFHDYACAESKMSDYFSKTLHECAKICNATSSCTAFQYKAMREPYEHSGTRCAISSVCRAVDTTKTGAQGIDLYMKKKEERYGPRLGVLT